MVSMLEVKTELPKEFQDRIDYFKGIYKNLDVAAEEKAARNAFTIVRTLKEPKSIEEFLTRGGVKGQKARISELVNWDRKENGFLVDTTTDLVRAYVKQVIQDKPFDRDSLPHGGTRPMNSWIQAVNPILVPEKLRPEDIRVLGGTSNRSDAYRGATGAGFHR